MGSTIRKLEGEEESVCTIEICTHLAFAALGRGPILCYKFFYYPIIERMQSEQQQIASQVSAGCQYECGDCATINVLKPRDPIRCQSCGYRILYKTRTKRLIQYEAR